MRLWRGVELLKASVSLPQVQRQLLYENKNESLRLCGQVWSVSYSSLLIVLFCFEPHQCSGIPPGGLGEPQRGARIEPRPAQCRQAPYPLYYPSDPSSASFYKPISFYKFLFTNLLKTGTPRPNSHSTPHPIVSSCHFTGHSGILRVGNEPPLRWLLCLPASRHAL